MPDELDPLTYDVLDHIARYRIGVPEALGRTPPFAGLSLKRIKRTLHALTEGEALLASAPLYGDHRYFYLTRTGEAAIGEPEAGQGGRRRAGALSEVAKVRAYGILAFCCLSERPRQRLTPEEFRRAFTAHHRPGLPMSYYADQEARRLGFIRVDAGGGGRWDRIAARIIEDIARHRAIAAFGDTIAAGAFELALVTATERKAERLRPLFEEETRMSGIPVRVHAVPQLIDLIAPLPRK
jgi:hypothetical protein